MEPEEIIVTDDEDTPAGAEQSPESGSANAAVRESDKWQNEIEFHSASCAHSNDGCRPARARPCLGGG